MLKGVVTVAAIDADAHPSLAQVFLLFISSLMMTFFMFNEMLKSIK